MKAKENWNLSAQEVRKNVMCQALMIEYVKGNISTYEQVSEMIDIIMKKLNMTRAEAGEFARFALCLDEM